MKRELFQNITAIPYKSGDAINREGFLSAVIGANVSSGAEVTITVTHSDDGKTYEAVTDKLVFPEAQTKGGVLKFTAPTVEAVIAEDAKNGETSATSAGSTPAGMLVGIDVDLVGLKNFVKFAVTGAETALAVVLGDAAVQPV